MIIQIKDVVGTEENKQLIAELCEVGFPEGSIIENVITNENGKCFWDAEGVICVAYIGETCIILNRIKAEK